MKKEAARDRILREASALFYREGVRAVGIDKIIEKSETAKATFYHNFCTKDDLIVAYLEQYVQAFRNRVADGQRQYPNDPLEQLYLILEKTIDRLERPDFRGCPFLNTAVEFPDENHPGYRVAIEFRQEMRRTISQLAKEAGARDPEALSTQLVMLYNGAVTMAALDGMIGDTEQFRNAARLLIESHFQPSSRSTD